MTDALSTTHAFGYVTIDILLYDVLLASLNMVTGKVIVVGAYNSCSSPSIYTEYNTSCDGNLSVQKAIFFNLAL